MRTQYAGTPAVPVKNQCKAIATRPRMIQILPQSMIRISFLTGMAGLRTAGNVPPPPPSNVKINAK